MLKLSRNPFSQGHAAENTLGGIVSNGSDWVESIVLVDRDGAQLIDVDDDDWQFQFRACDRESSATLTLTTATELTVTEGASATTLDIEVLQSALSSLDGDYVADLVSKDGSGVLTHRASGVVTFKNAPIAF